MQQKLPRAIAALTVIAVCLSVFVAANSKHSATTQDYRVIRASMIRSALRWTWRDPVIFVGDSITEKAHLPYRICGRGSINAGIGGLDTGTYLAALDKIGDFKGAAIVIALGTNDAVRDHGGDFAETYRTLVVQLESRAPILFLAGLPPIEIDGKASRILDVDKVVAINARIRDIAEQTGHSFIDLSVPMQTLDGVHLSQEGYKSWLKAIREPVSAALGC